MVVQADERVGSSPRGERGVEARELPGIEMAVVHARDRAVHHDEQPGAVARRELVDEWRAIELALTSAGSSWFPGRQWTGAPTSLKSRAKRP